MDRRQFVQLLAALPALRLLNRLPFVRPAQATAQPARQPQPASGYGAGAYGGAAYPGSTPAPEPYTVYISSIHK